MKIHYYTLLALLVLLSSCEGIRKTVKTEPAPSSTTVLEDPAELPIREVEEKLVEINEMPPDPSDYFVIIGSFRNPENANKYQEQISRDGFASILLKNEEGLIRVSVLATNQIAEARSEIRRIREDFPKYNDTWLLIRKR